MKHSQEVIKYVLELHKSGVPNRTIADEVFGSATKESTVRGILKRRTNPKEDNSRILLISDMHIPYHHPDTLAFLEHLKQKYKPTRVISMGDECFPPDVEVMTEMGFVKFSSLEDEKVAQWHENGKITFVKPQRKIEKDFSGNLIEYSHKTMTIRCTPKHNLVKINPSTKTVHRREAWDSYGNETWYIPRTGSYDGEGVALTDDEIRLLVAFQADGTFTKGAARFMFTKERKATRLVQLLKSCGIPYNEHSLKGGGFQYYIEVAHVPHYFTKYFEIPVIQFSIGQKKVFLEELGLWDGTKKEGRVRYVSAVHSNVEYVQFMANTSGFSASRIKKEGNCKTVDILWDRENSSLKSAKKTDISYNGKVYCVTVDSGMIIVRIDGNIVVTGNCDKHALSYHDSDPDLKSAGDELRASLPVIQKLYKMFPKMDILESNHGSLVWRKAKTNGIPRHYIKSYNDVLEVGDGWKWHHDLTIELPNGNKCYFHHGKSSDVLKLSQQMGMNAVQGHYHNDFSAKYWANPNGLYWGLQIGCLIDDESYAFSYNNVNIKRPLIGTGLIVDSLPILEPMILDEHARWIGG